MPIHEYRCAPCGHAFETLIRGDGDSPHCPKCGGIDLAKQFSVPASARGGDRADASSSIGQATGDPSGCGPGHCRTGMCSFD